jgi:hypothetical protein
MCWEGWDVYSVTKEINELMLRLFFLTLITLFAPFALCAQKPLSGTYTYAIAWAEWQGKSLGATCTVKIKGDSIKVIWNGTGGMQEHKGTILDEGIIMRHRRTGKWIIGHSAKDKDAKEVGGCEEGPTEIDFKRKRVWQC